MATLPETKTLALDLEQGWLTVWFNQPERRNPLTDDAVEDLAAVIEAIAPQRDIRGMTIRGKGGFFCAGGDLKGFKAMATGETEASMRMSRRIGDVLADLNALPQVTVAVIEGAAMAGGWCRLLLRRDDWDERRQVRILGNTHWHYARPDSALCASEVRVFDRTATHADCGAICW